MVKKPFFVCILVLFFSGGSLARWADPKEADFVVNFETSHTKVRKDGTYVVTVERQIEILNERGRMEHGLFRLTYGVGTKTTIVSAKTINPKETKFVQKEDIEVKPLASSGPGFDVTTQITIPYPDVNVGSKLYVKFHREVLKPLIPGMYFFRYPLGWNESLQNLEATIESEMPLYSEYHDPDKVLEVTEKAKFFKVKLKKPVFRMVMDEEQALMDNTAVTWVGITTAKQWSDIPKTSIMAYENAMTAPLPEKFARIFEAAQMKKSDLEKINAVTSALAEQVRYVGDWRLVEGAYHPRSLKQISHSGYGDCKDFTVATAAILKKLGFETHAAWVMRGNEYIDTPLKLAAPDFNHAIVYARKDGKEYWLDPTNLVSFAQGLFNDIANRSAVVLFPSGIVHKKIPPMHPTDGSVQVNLHLHVVSEKFIEGTGDLSLLGRGALSMTGMELSYAKKSLDYTLIKWVTDVNHLRTWKLGDYSFMSRIVRDMKTDFQFGENWRSLVTSAGKGYLIPASPYLPYFRLRTDDRVSHVQVDDPIVWRREYHIKGRKVQFNEATQCQGDSPWARFSRHLRKVGDDLVLTDEFTMKVDTLLVSDLKSEAFNKFRTALLPCMNDAVIVFQ